MPIQKVKNLNQVIAEKGFCTENSEWSIEKAKIKVSKSPSMITHIEAMKGRGKRDFINSNDTVNIVNSYKTDGETDSRTKISKPGSPSPDKIRISDGRSSAKDINTKEGILVIRSTEKIEY